MPQRPGESARPNIISLLNLGRDRTHFDCTALSAYFVARTVIDMRWKMKTRLVLYKLL